jgi:hypothetical protein
MKLPNHTTARLDGPSATRSTRPVISAVAERSNATGSALVHRTKSSILQARSANPFEQHAAHARKARSSAVFVSTVVATRLSLAKPQTYLGQRQALSQIIQPVWRQTRLIFSLVRRLLLAALGILERAHCRSPLRIPAMTSINTAARACGTSSIASRPLWMRGLAYPQEASLFRYQ